MVTVKHVGLLLGTAILWLALSPAPLYAQLSIGAGPQPEPVDSLYEIRITEAWRDVQDYWQRRDRGEATPSEDPQPAYAREFFQYYLDHPLSPTGERALTGAFSMWGDAGLSNEIERAVERISPDADVWTRILGGIKTAFEKQERPEDYTRLLNRLNAILTQPRSRSGVLLRLADHYVAEEQPDSARTFYEQVVALNAYSVHANRAHAALYEINALGIGKGAPDFIAEDVKGDTVSLAALRGKVVVLEFWATWCGPCLPEIPHLKQLDASFGDEVVMIGISLDDDAAGLATFLEQEGITWPQIREAAMFDGRLPSLYNVSAIPRNFVIDREGRIAHKDLRGEALAEAVRLLTIED
jgi:peroxiredoxin